MNPDELTAWFDNSREVFGTAFLEHDEPWRQSGFSGPEDRWVSLRKPVADCVDRSGSFLDIGCANGYLLECCLRWTAERDVEIDPYGLDISPVLVKLAKERLPQYADRFFVGNSFEWIPPRKFDFVRTELVYVPGEFERQYVEFLFENYVSPGGRLLVASYMEDMLDAERGSLPGCHVTRRILDRLEEVGLTAIDYKDGHDPVKGRKVRIAVLAGIERLND